MTAPAVQLAIAVTLYQAEEAVEFYTAIFRNSKILNVARYGKAGHEIHGKAAGTVMAVAFELDGQAWQVVARVLLEMINDPESKKSQRAMEAMLRMKKIDIGKLKRAYAGS